MTEITEAELFAELDKLPRKEARILTEQEIRLIAHARDMGVEWDVLAKFINDKFGRTYNGHTLACKYRSTTSGS